jgi:LysR family transcriptional regulator of gallate degradation
MTRGLLLETDLVTALSREQVAPDFRSGLLAVLPVDLPQTLRRAGFMRRKGSILSPAAERLAAQIRQVIAQDGPG